MSKKHFLAIARILATSVSRDQIIDRLISYFEQTCPQFDSGRFRRACNENP